MKKILLLSCLSLAPLSSKCFAMEEKPSESGTRHITKRESSIEILEDRYLTKQDSFTTSEDLYLDLDLIELRKILQNAEKHLDSNLLKEQNNTKIMLEKIGVPDTHTPLIVQDEVAKATEGSILDKDVVHSNKRTPDTSSIISNKIDTNITQVGKTEGGNLLNNTTNNKERKKLKKRLSLNTQQTTEKTRVRRLSLSLDFKGKSFFEEKEKSSEKK